MEEEEDYEGNPEEFDLYDENGQPQKFVDQHGNEIPFEEVQQYMLQQQQEAEQ